ncbi:MAG: L,D-transpeptidase family protein [Patescibacteria group bacterium]|jgi:lipoprotein-anchoring transpeptidase ErfK/SrfK
MKTKKYYYGLWVIGVCFLASVFLPKITQASFYRDPFVKIYQANYNGEFQEADNFFAYDPQFKGGVSLALADLGGDGVNEVITGPGIGSEPIVRVFRLDGSLIREFYAYASNMDKGVNVAAGDLDGDGKEEILTAPRTGGGPHVRAFDGYGQPKFNYGFFAYDYKIQNGVNIAACDVNGDGKDEIITGPGVDSDPVVRVFNYRGRSIMPDYYPFSQADRGGVTVGCANVDGGLEEEIIMGIQSKGENWIKVYKGNKEKNVLGYFKAWPDGVRTGVNVAGGDIDADGQDEVVASVYGSGGPQVKMYEAYGKEVNPGFFAFEEDFSGGVNIAVGQADKYKRDEVIVAPSKPKPTGRTDLERYVLVDLSEQRLYAYREGYLENSFLISSGKTGPTPTGSFYVRRKIYNHLYSGPGYYLPNTLYNMEFLPSYYLHGAYWHNNFGHPMSHGCVNISYTNAAWLWDWTSVGTSVFIQY